MLSRPVRITCLVIFLVCALNTITMIAIASATGGSAISGHVVDGTHYLSLRSVDTPVSPTYWNFRYWHEVSAFPTTFIAMLAIAAFGYSTPQTTKPRHTT